MKFHKILIPTLTFALALSLLGCKKSKTTNRNSSTKTTANANVTTNAQRTKTAKKVTKKPIEYREGVIPTPFDTSVYYNSVNAVIEYLAKTDITEYDLASATAIEAGGSIDSSGVYLLTGKIDLTEAINFTKKATSVHLIIKDADINIADDKAISSKLDLEITFLGENTITNSLGENNSDENLIKCGGNLTINGGGSVTLKSTKSSLKVDGTCNLFGATINIDSVSNGIGATNIYIDGAILNIKSKKDGLHSEIDYDKVEDESTVVFDVNNGFVYIKSGDITINSIGDGIQADTFVRIDGGKLDITTNGGAPKNITKVVSNSVSGKGIKAGAIDYTLENDPDTELDFESDEYGIIINGGEMIINANDDAIHSNGYFIINGGSATIDTGDDGIHADTVGEMNDGDYTIEKCFEGYEAAKVQISGGILIINASDDGINAGNGSRTSHGETDEMCHVIISGGTITVDAHKDGIDSNNSFTISGGTIYVNGSFRGPNTALDSETPIVITGGEMIAFGATWISEEIGKNSTQYVIRYINHGDVARDSYIRLVDSNNNTVIDYTNTRKGAKIIITSNKLEKDGTYYLYINDELVKTIKITNIITEA